MSASDPQLLAAVRLQSTCLTPRQRERLLQAAGGLAALAELAPQELAARGAPREAASAFDAVPRAWAERELLRAAERGTRAVLRDDPAFPPLLRETPDPPVALWVRGALPDPARLPVAIVGPRRPSAYGVAAVRQVAREMAELGVTVVSGGARGIDSLAHEMALDAGAPTVAVLGCGVDVAYPRRNASLFARIAAAGAVVSEHPLGTEPQAFHFPVRNRILAGWARAVVVVEASLKSGTLITARLALDLGRDVLAVPGSIFAPTSEGTNELLARGARPCRGARDLLAELRPDELARLALPCEPAADEPAPRDPLLARLTRGEAQGLDALADLLGLEVPALLARLSEWEAAGLVHRSAGGLYARQ